MLNVSPQVGDAVVRFIEGANKGQQVVIVLVVLPVNEEDGSLGQPQFVTDLQPAEMEDVLVQIAGGFALAGKPIIDGKYHA